MGSTRWVIQYALLAQSLCSVDRISSFTRSCVNISVSECLSRKWDHFVSRRISHTFAILFLFQCHCIVSFSFTMVNLPPGLPDLSVVQKPSTKKCCVHYGLLNKENMEDIAQQRINIRKEFLLSENYKIPKEMEAWLTEEKLPKAQRNQTDMCCKQY